MIIKTKKLSIFFLLLVLASCKMPSLGSGNSSVTIKEHYYNIYALSAKGLSEEIGKNGVPFEGGRYAAFTSWYIKWNYKYEQRDGMCYISAVKTTLDVDYTYPKWANKFMASEDLRIKWMEFESALRNHEEGHKDFGVKAAKEIEEAILAVEPTQNCSQLGNLANDAGYEVLRKYQQLELQYDSETDHGRTQGAVLP
jgi:predicted secreted Zn-dependent protease